MMLGGLGREQEKTNKQKKMTAKPAFPLSPWPALDPQLLRRPRPPRRRRTVWQRVQAGAGRREGGGTTLGTRPRRGQTACATTRVASTAAAAEPMSWRLTPSDGAACAESPTPAVVVCTSYSRAGHAPHGWGHFCAVRYGACSRPISLHLDTLEVRSSNLSLKCLPRAAAAAVVVLSGVDDTERTAGGSMPLRHSQRHLRAPCEWTAAAHCCSPNHSRQRAPCACRRGVRFGARCVLNTNRPAGASPTPKRHPASPISPCPFPRNPSHQPSLSQIFSPPSQSPNTRDGRRPFDAAHTGPRPAPPAGGRH